MKKSRLQWERRALHAAVIGRHKDDVLALLGAPDMTETDEETYPAFFSGRSIGTGKFRDSWTYLELCKDPIALEPDIATRIKFNERGIVELVQFV
jgi:hypothetical protein